MLRELLDADATGAVALSGPFGSGKSTAVRAMRELFAGVDRLAFADDESASRPRELESGMLLVYTLEQLPTRSRDAAALTMAPWTRDDLIEYLLAAHPNECGSVVARLPNVDVYDFFRGLPGLWRPVLDEMAASEAIQAPNQALLLLLAREWPDPSTFRACADLAAISVFGVRGWERNERAVEDLPPTASQRSYLRYYPVCLVLSVQRFFERLVDDRDASVLASKVPPLLLPRIGQNLAKRDAARRLVAIALVGADPALHGTAASVLNACDRTAVKTELAKLDGAKVEGIDLRGAQLERADLTGLRAKHLDFGRADLAGAEFDGARIGECWSHEAVLDGVSFRSCTIEKLWANGTSCRDADFTSATIERALLHSCKLQRSTFERARLSTAVLARASLSETRFIDTDLSEADLSEAKVEGALFRDVNCEGAKLREVDFRKCALESTRFARADLRKAKLDRLRLDEANFSGADLSEAHLTGTRMRRANLHDTRLCAAGLADVDWEGSDLRGADFTNASFHLGSSRSGLVLNAPPMEGTRTGYYTDEMSELTHKAPEEIRKANLRGCDLRGAKIDACDFYLVDLRDAQLDPEQLVHVRRCGAILRRRT